MIVDRLGNIGLYAAISDDIATGLQHLSGMDASVALGSYQLSGRAKVVVSSYKTEIDRPNEYEAHQRVIDIQYPIYGVEQVMWSPLYGMENVQAYNTEKDVGYWNNPSQKTSIITGDGVFAIFFPEDAHRPCMAVNGNEIVIKKVTLKISI